MKTFYLVLVPLLVVGLVYASPTINYLSKLRADTLYCGLGNCGSDANGAGGDGTGGWINSTTQTNTSLEVFAEANMTVINAIRFNTSDWVNAPQIQYNKTCINILFGTSGNGGIHICQN